METQKFIQGHKTARYALITTIVVLVCGTLIILFKYKADQKTEIIAKIEAMRLSKCQEIVVAKGQCNVTASLSQPQTLFGVTLPKFMAGSKSAEYNGPLIMRFGYDSSMLLFPRGTRFVSDGSFFHPHYTISIPNFQKPKVLPDPATRGYVKESKSYFTGDIPAETFFGYLDSLAVVGGNKAIEDNSDYFRDSYMSMVFQLTGAMLGSSSNYTVTIGGLPYDETQGNQTEKKQNFVEDITASKNM